MSYDESDTQFQIDNASNLIAASVSELSACSSDGAYEVELALLRALKEVSPHLVRAVYDAVNAAFMEGNEDE